ncbi:MAG: ATP-binding protein [Lewinellaceae bacterium]|nr:ATP-binding protein [Lewinellaceae bacterium]
MHEYTNTRIHGPYRILLTGPESTGKTLLARRLAEAYQTAWAPEYARAYLETLGRPYEEEDLLHIAHGQMLLEDFQAQFARRILPCDTGLLVLKVWSEYKYGHCHPWILEQLHRRTYDLYLLCGTDAPWAYDPLRENPNEREELYAIYKRELEQMGVSFTEVWGGVEERVEIVRGLIGY